MIASPAPLRGRWGRSGIRPYQYAAKEKAARRAARLSLELIGGWPQATSSFNGVPLRTIMIGRPVRVWYSLRESMPSAR